VPTYIKTITFDCADAVVLARFWAAALGTDMDDDSTPERAYVEAPGWGGPNMWFVRVPEPKVAKNRMHFVHGRFCSAAARPACDPPSSSRHCRR
jgi:hypothetical protein